MRAAPWSEAIREAKKFRLIDLVQYRDCGPLDDLVFQHGHPDRPLPAIRLRYIHPLSRARSICTPGQPFGEVLKMLLQVLPVVPPGLSVDARCGFPLEAEVRLPKHVHGVDVVHERGELHLLVSLCCLTYPPQGTVHLPPALHPVGVVLKWIPLGQAPSLRLLRR